MNRVDGIGKPRVRRKPGPRKPGIRIAVSAATTDSGDWVSGRSPYLESILEMARVLIADVGIEGLNMRDLAAATGSSLRTLYANFGSKDQLLVMVVADTFEGLIDLVRKNQPRGLSAIGNVEQLVQSLIEIAMARQMYVKTIMGIYHKHDTNQNVSSTLYSMTYDRMSVCVDQLIGQRPVPRKEVDLLKEEATDRIFSVMMKWTQQKIADELLPHRLTYSILSCFGRHATPEQASEIDQALTRSLAALTKA